MNIINLNSYTALVNGNPVYMEKLEILGVSTEDKGYLKANNKGSTFACTDNGDEFIWDGASWVQKGKSILDAIGNLAELDTTEKGEIVGAINEVLASIV